MEHPEPTEAIHANAQLAITQLGPLSRLATFGFDRESVAWTDGYLSRISASGELTDKARDGLVKVIGSFVGECVIRRYGGTWQEVDDRWGVVVTTRIIVFPFDKVRKQLINGSEDSVLSFYDLIPRSDDYCLRGHDQIRLEDRRHGTRRWWRFW
jgi:hypothetical protein